MIRLVISNINANPYLIGRIADNKMNTVHFMQ